MRHNGRLDRYVISAGRGSIIITTGFLNDTWAYDFNTNRWTNLLGSTPTARAAHAMAYGSRSDRVILFGGLSFAGNTTTVFNDTWAYDFNTNTWTNLNPGNAPRGR